MSETTKICPKCKTEHPEDAKFCRGCGAKLVDEILREHPPEPEELLCPECKVSLPPGSNFCPTCGAKIQG